MYGKVRSIAVQKSKIVEFPVAVASIFLIGPPLMVNWICLARAELEHFWVFQEFTVMLTLSGRRFLENLGFVDIHENSFFS